MTYNFDSEEFKNTSLYKTIINEYAGKGLLKVEAFTANGAYPLEGVEIIVSKDFGNDKVIFFNGKTNSSGMIETIVLPTKEQTKEIEEAADILFTSYDLKANYPEFNLEKMFNVSIFDNVKVIQPISFPINDLIEGEQD